MSILNNIKNIFKKQTTFIAVTMAYIKGDTKHVELFYDYNDVWMNTIYDKDERFMFAREAIRYRDRIIHNLRLQVIQNDKKPPNAITIKNNALLLEIVNLKTNNLNLRDRCAFLRERPDLPADRIPAYSILVFLQEELVKLRRLKDIEAATTEVPNTKEGWIISGPKTDNIPDIIVLKKEDIKTAIKVITNDGRYADMDDYTATKLLLNYKYHPDSIVKDLDLK